MLPAVRKLFEDRPGIPNHRNASSTTDPYSQRRYDGTFHHSHSPGQPVERPHLGPPERPEPPDPERGLVAAGQVQVDRQQAQRHDHRVGLGAEDVVHVAVVADRILHREQECRREQPGHVRGVAALGPRVGQPERDPPREDQPAQRDRHRGHHPQPQRVVADHRVRHREQVWQRLPRRRAVRVELEVDRQLAPHEPSVRVIARPRARVQHDQQRHAQQADGGQHPPVAVGQLAPVDVAARPLRAVRAPGSSMGGGASRVCSDTGAARTVAAGFGASLRSASVGPTRPHPDRVRIQAVNSVRTGYLASRMPRSERGWGRNQLASSNLCSRRREGPRAAYVSRTARRLSSCARRPGFAWTWPIDAPPVGRRGAEDPPVECQALELLYANLGSWR